MAVSVGCLLFDSNFFRAIYWAVLAGSYYSLTDPLTSVKR